MLTMFRSYLSQIGVVRERPQLSRHAHRQLWIIAIVFLPAILACNLVKTDAPPTPARRIIRLVLLPPVTPTATAGEPEVVSPDTIVPTPTSPAPVAPSTPVVAQNTVVPDLESQQNNRPKPTLTALVVLNVRSGPATDFPTIGQLQPGQTVEVLGRDQAGTWWQVVYPPGSDNPAWVSADPQYVAVSDSGEVLIAQAPSLPTATPVSIAQITPTPPLTQTSTITSTDSFAAPVPPPSDSGWDFANIRFDPDQYDDSLVLYGNMLNNTGASQELFFVTGTFYDDQHQLIADEESTYDYWPFEIVPPGGQVPFELTVFDIRSMADFNLSVETQPSDITPSPDFEFFDVQSSNEEYDYCLEGKFRNKGQDLGGMLTVVAVLYDDQDQVINFGDDPFEVDTFKNGDEEEFFVCVDPLGQPVTRYELLAWGL